MRKLLLILVAFGLIGATAFGVTKAQEMDVVYGQGYASVYKNSNEISSNNVEILSSMFIELSGEDAEPYWSKDAFLGDIVVTEANVDETFTIKMRNLTAWQEGMVHGDIATYFKVELVNQCDFEFPVEPGMPICDPDIMSVRIEQDDEYSANLPGFNPVIYDGLLKDLSFDSSGIIAVGYLDDSHTVLKFSFYVDEETFGQIDSDQVYSNTYNLRFVELM